MPNFNLPDSDSAVVPVGNIARAAVSNPASQTDGAEVPAMADHAGRFVVTEGHTRENCKSQQTTISASTAETTIVTGVPGQFHDLTGLIITTVDAAVATITIKDGTAGTTKLVLDYPNAASVPNTPLVIDFTPPLSQNATGSNWTATVSVNAGHVNITAQFITNA